MTSFIPSYRHAPHQPRLGDVEPSEQVQLTIVLHPATPLDAATHAGTPGISRETYRALHATPDDAMERVRRIAKQFGLTVAHADASAHVIKLRGTYAQAIAAFQPDEIGRYGTAGRQFVARSGHLTLPEEIRGDVVAVMGLDQRPVAKPHFRVRPAASAAATSYTPPQVATAYSFPPNLDGTGQTIALIELGGGYDPTQVAAYFAGLGIKRSGTLTDVSVDSATNGGTADPTGADGEVQLDIEVAGSIAPAANIAVYFAPNQGAGFQDAISQAVNDTTNNPSVISISWGGPESSYSAQDLDAISQTMAQAATLGITICVASGDNGSSDGATTNKSLNVDFPASSPNALACGGTSLQIGGAETAWNDGTEGGATGGGYSTHFPVPAWQNGAVTSKMRGVPDVSGDADPATGYKVDVDGTAAVVGGTSAVAPLWAALIALVNQSLGHKVGFVNPTLYANPTALKDITSGNNGAYKAAVGWDPATGLGRPVGTSVLAVLRGVGVTS